MQASYHSPLEGESQKPSRQAKADAVGGGRPPAKLRPAATPLSLKPQPLARLPFLCELTGSDLFDLVSRCGV